MRDGNVKIKKGKNQIVNQNVGMANLSLIKDRTPNIAMTAIKNLVMDALQIVKLNINTNVIAPMANPNVTSLTIALRLEIMNGIATMTAEKQIGANILKSVIQTKDIAMILTRRKVMDVTNVLSKVDM